MAIGVAMLGFGAAGTLLALRPPRRALDASRGFAGAAALSALALLASPALVHRVPLDPARLVWGVGPWLGLVVVYALLALPFLAVAVAVLLALMLESERPGRLYGASFLGSALGAIGALAALALFLPARALAAPAVLAALGALAATRQPVRWPGAASLAGLMLALALGALAWPPWLLRVTPYKGLPQAEALPSARRVAERASPLGWVVAVEAPAFRYAPGLSLAYDGAFPSEIGLFVDGESAGALTRGDGASAELADWLPGGLPYASGAKRSVLLLGAGGNTEVLGALARGARRVVAVELQPGVVQLARAFPTTGSARGVGQVEWVVGDARGYAARSHTRFDLIAIGPGAGFGAAAGGVYSLDQDFMHTTEAYASFLRRLERGGMLAVTRWLVTPPREGVRVILTVGEALRRVNPAAAARGLVVSHSWGTVTVLAKPSGFTAAEVGSLRGWARSRRFDMDWYPGIGEPEPGFNELDQPVLYEAANAAAGGRAATRVFAGAYPFEVAPVGDGRPYPHQFLRARALPRLLSSGVGGWLPFAEWGYLALAATLVQSLLVAALLLVLPAVLGRRPRVAPGPQAPRRGATLLYFVAIGVAYMAAEIAAIQQLGLLLGHPVHAVTAALAGLLVFSGLGSMWSDRLGAPHAVPALGALVVALTACALLLLRVVWAAQPLPLALRALVALIALAPPAFLMGLPFPFGLRLLAAGEALPWAWASNAFASAVGAPLAALVALEAGTPWLFGLAAAAYAGAAAALRKRSSG
jgi:predicted RNA methylase